MLVGMQACIECIHHSAGVTHVPLRRLVGATGDLYDAGSPAHHLALEQLWEVLRKVGFKLSRKRADEKTLRVYPVRFQGYPLLNPGFGSPGDAVAGEVDGEFLMIAALSKGDERLVHQIGLFTSSAACRFIPDGRMGPTYFYHGWFAIPLTFAGKRGSYQIDFDAIKSPLEELLIFLRKAVNLAGVAEI
jgi:hypothetical protein